MKRDQILARLAEIQAALGGMEAGAEGYTDEQVAEVNALNEEFERLNGQIEAMDKIDAITAKASASAGRKVTPAAPQAAVRVQVGADGKDRFGGFNSNGDFLAAVIKAGRTGEVDQKFRNVMYEKNGEDGGFLLTPDISDAILKKFESPDSLMSRINKMNISSNAMTIRLDEAAPWSNGLVAYWIAEGAPYTESKPKFADADFRLHKLGVLVKATDELLEDVTAMESYIKSAAPEAINYKANAAILSGDGVGKPSGLLNSTYGVTVAKESGQSADTIVPANIIKMYSRMLPGSLPNAVWLMNAGAGEELLGMKNSQGDYLYLAPGSQLNQSPYATLMGRPVIPMLSGAPALGDSGDITFVDLKSYWMVTKAGGAVKQATSIHLHFDRDIQTFKFTLRLDGKVPFSTPVTTEYGAYQMSSIVKLADRA